MEISLDPLVWFAAAFAIGLPLTSIVHEFGHGAVATACGLPVRTMQIGRGRPLFQIRLATMSLRACSWPFGGRTILYPLIGRALAARLVFMLGGALANATAFAYLLGLNMSGGFSAPVHAAVFGLATAQLTGLLNLVPFRGREIDSDGRQFLRALINYRQTPRGYVLYRELVHKRYAAYPAREPAPSALASMVVYYAARLDEQPGGPDSQSSRREQQALHGDGRLKAEERMVLLDRLITDSILGMGARALPDLDLWSTEALALGPHVAALRRSRGAVLILLGRPAAGRALIEANPPQEKEVFDVAISRLFVALAMLRMGQTEAAAAAMPAIRAAAARQDDAALRPLSMWLDGELRRALADSTAEDGSMGGT